MVLAGLSNSTEVCLICVNMGCGWQLVSAFATPKWISMENRNNKGGKPTTRGNDDGEDSGQSCSRMAERTEATEHIIFVPSLYQLAR